MIVAAVSSLAPQAEGRVFQWISYRELLDRSDMVVIATPTSRTRDTNQPCDLPNLSLKCTGVETVFEISAVLKGDKETRTFTLHHCRVADEVNYANGPTFVHFEGPDAKSASSYLLFLVREPDGRYAPTGGQMDPGFKAVGRLPFPE